MLQAYYKVLVSDIKERQEVVQELQKMIDKQTLHLQGSKMSLEVDLD